MTLKGKLFFPRMSKKTTQQRTGVVSIVRELNCQNDAGHAANQEEKNIQ
jgi:hypothetical protein